MPKTAAGEVKPVEDGLWQLVQSGDGRWLEVVTGGHPGGMPLIFHNGSPTAALLFPPLAAAAAERHGLSLVTWSRHGAWLAVHVPRAIAHLHPGQGHLSLGVARIARIVGDLVAVAAAAASGTRNGAGQ